jgi:tripeptidyl-peptidase-1
VNPTLYAHPEVLNDIVNGSNPNCGSSGFETAVGWDPVSAILPFPCFQGLATRMD